MNFVMNRKLPRYEKICFCMPLRGGVIFLVYINLTLTLVADFAFGLLDLMQFLQRSFTIAKGADYWMSKAYKSKWAAEPRFIFAIIVLCTLAEIVMSVVILIGLHRNRIRLVEIYLNFIVFMTMFMMIFRMFDIGDFWEYELPVIVFYLAIKCYYILAIRSHVKKQEVADKPENEEVEIEMDLPKEDNEIDKNDALVLVNNELHPAIVFKDFENELVK